MTFKSAVISEDGKYRYSLLRVWGDEPRATFVMLNPSTADAELDDPTIRRCVGFAKAWGCGGIEVVNLFAYRATIPLALYGVADPVGPENDRYIVEATTPHKRIKFVVCAWGVVDKPLVDGRANFVKQLIGERYALEFTAGGHPRHPLYLRSGLMPQRWA